MKIDFTAFKLLMGVRYLILCSRQVVVVFGLVCGWKDSSSLSE